MRLQKRQTKATPGDYSLTILPLTRAKLYLRESNSDQDNVITDLINAGVQHIEAGLDFSIDTSGLIYQYYDVFESTTYIWHRYITATDLVVEYWDGSDWQTVNASNYRVSVSSTPPCVFLTSTGEWPTTTSEDSTDVLRIGFKMDTSHSFLDDIKAAVMAFVAWKYENPEGITDMPSGIAETIKRHRLYS